jgi:hypothetical protein
LGTTFHFTLESVDEISVAELFSIVQPMWPEDKLWFKLGILDECELEMDPVHMEDRAESAHTPISPFQYVCVQQAGTEHGTFPFMHTSTVVHTHSSHALMHTHTGTHVHVQALTTMLTLAHTLLTLLHVWSHLLMDPRTLVYLAPQHSHVGRCGPWEERNQESDQER